MSNAYWLVIACGVLAVLYGIYASRSVLSASDGNDKMREIAEAVQEGAAAYLNRQYMTIGIVGVGDIGSCEVAELRSFANGEAPPTCATRTCSVLF